MQTLLYIIWFLIPTFFLGAWLWGTLEKFGGNEQRGATKDALKQAFFVLACVLMSVAIDQSLLPDLVSSYAPDFLPLGFFQVILLPAILYIGALIVGPSREIRISKAPRLGKRK
ncbi:MAG: hypothetical protein K1X79_11380 [Oligoflexia bacterium]|nr:hypothetical protein [Oligoflexia bacterium]